MNALNLQQMYEIPEDKGLGHSHEKSCFVNCYWAAQFSIGPKSEIRNVWEHFYLFLVIIIQLQAEKAKYISKNASTISLFIFIP